jgi:hypothetical protein
VRGEENRRHDPLQSGIRLRAGDEKVYYIESAWMAFDTERERIQGIELLPATRSVRRRHGSDH